MSTIINWLRPSDAYICHQNRQSLIQIMACCLFSTKPLSKPVLTCQLDPWEHISLTFGSKYDNFHWKKNSFRMYSAEWWPFCLCLNVLIDLWLPGHKIMSHLIHPPVSRACFTHSSIHCPRESLAWFNHIWYKIGLKPSFYFCTLFEHVHA